MATNFNLNHLPLFYYKYLRVPPILPHHYFRSTQTSLLALEFTAS